MKRENIFPMPESAVCLYAPRFSPDVITAVDGLLLMQNYWSRRIDNTRWWRAAMLPARYGIRFNDFRFHDSGAPREV